MQAYQITPRRKKTFLFGLSVNTSIIIINVVLFLVFILLVNFNILTWEHIAIKPTNIIDGKYLWTFLTSMFMHGGFGHLLINMFVLFSLGGMMERILGRKRYLYFYLISGIFAALLFVLLAYFFGNTDLGARIFGSPINLAVGASGAIFAIAGLYVMLLPKAKFMIIFLPFFSLSAYLMIPLVLVLTWVVSSSVGFGVGNTAHLGGLIAGLVYGIYLRSKYKNKVKALSKLLVQ